MATDRAPTFAMFCTIDGGAYLFARVSDEIEAVRAYSTHVEDYAVFVDHAPFIHMEPMRDEWRPVTHIDPADLDPARNLFRRPAERAS
jgi:hypothetical protein